MRGIVEELRELERYEEAFALLPDALAAAREANFKTVMTKLKCCEGRMCLEYRFLPDALKAAQQGLRIAQEINDYEGIALSSLLLGECYLNLADYDEAYRELKKTERLASAIGLYTVNSQSKRSLSKLMEIQGDLAQALAYLKAHLEEEQVIRARGVARRAKALSGQVRAELLNANVKVPRTYA